MKKVSKKILYGIVLTGSLLLCNISCDKEWTEPNLLSSLVPENAYIDARGFNASIANCDNNARAEFYGDPPPLLTEAIFSEVCVEGTTDKSGPAQDMNASITPTAQLNHQNFNRIGWYWDNFYVAIKNANMVLSRIRSVQFKDTMERNQIIANAYFHRSYRYYRLTNQFGDVPFVGHEYTKPKYDFGSTKREVILRKIKKDMEWAVKYAKDNVDRGKVTKGACFHLLAKINLSLGEFDAAIAACDSIIKPAKITYSLMTSNFGSEPKEAGGYLAKIGVTRNDVVSRLHWYTNKAISANKEVLYMTVSREELEASRINTSAMRQAMPFWSNTSDAIMYPDNGRPAMNDNPGQEFDLVTTFGRGIGRFRGTSYHTREIWDDPNDLRHKKYNWMNMEDLVYNAKTSPLSTYYGKPLQLKGPSGNQLARDTIRSWYGWPHYKLYTPDPRNTKAGGGAGDWYIFRLAETYLIRAEAYWWKGQPDMAMADINKVRQRASCAAYTDASKIDIGTILDERARELFYEEARKTELTRISFLFAQFPNKTYKGKSYSIANFGTDNFFFDRIIEKNGFYNKNVRTVFGISYTMSPYHVLWPIPNSTIVANSQGIINQNYGYSGFEKNVAPLEQIAPEDDI